jgi:hypothetical protein
MMDFRSCFISIAPGLCALSCKSFAVISDMSLF